jgi:glycosyltransferase involved in cell wall biosynthesis
MKRHPIVMYLGGFAKVGGIEAFARDFLLAIAPAWPERDLVIWDARGKDNRLLNDIVRSGAKISGSPWRWGCTWNLPDYVLAPFGRSAVRHAAAVIFKRPPPLPILLWLRRASLSTGRRIPFIIVMPYRPLQYWGRSPDPRQLSSFDVIVVQSEDGRRDLEESGYRGRIENIPLLPPETAAWVDFPAHRVPGLIRLGYLGRMAAQKNLRYLLDVYRLLASANGEPRFELHLFGDGEERDQLKRRCGELSLPGVTFHGERPRAEIADAIDSCDLFLNTSLVEGQCLVALEVLSRGRPLVATPVGALPEILRQPELGRLAPLDDPAAFANAVAEVARKISDGAITPKSVVAAFRERFDRAAILQRYLDLLAESVGDERARN